MNFGRCNSCGGTKYRVEFLHRNDDVCMNCHMDRLRTQLAERDARIKELEEDNLLINQDLTRIYLEQEKRAERAEAEITELKADLAQSTSAVDDLMAGNGKLKEKT